jgi:putative nucleotidyltransferase with HDIG domain
LSDDNTQPDYSNLKKYLDSDYPLLATFKNTAPGTFKHSQNVSNLCEAVAEEFGLNVVLMKVCAMYHDIGKMWCPRYFSENQEPDQNPHDDLDPIVSYQLISKHISDSCVILITETDMPREVIEIIAQHHGNTVLNGIFGKSGSTNKDLFRYKTKIPDNEYSSILMIVDSVEATARSIADKMVDPDVRIECVKSTIDRLREDEQLDEMKVGKLRQIQSKLIRELNTIYHKRIDYELENESEKVLK